MADTTTTNLGLTKPEVGASADTWGGKINTNLDLVDGLFAAAGNGTSVGLNVGTGKTLAVGGTLTMSALTASTALALNASKQAVSVTNTGTGNNVLSASPTLTGTIDAAAQTLSGNLTFSSTAQRITADMSNATVSNRFAFQNSVANAQSIVNFLPNGTGTVSQLQLFNNSTPTNGSFAGLFVNASESRLQSGTQGSGTYLPLTFFTNGSEQARLDTSGNLGIGTSSPTEKLHVAGALRVTGAQTTAGTGVYLDQTSGTGGVSVYGPDNSTQGTFRIYTATANGGTGSTKLTLDTSGNLGLGVTPSAWQSGVKAFQNGAGALYTINTVQQRLSLNAYRDSAGTMRYINSSINAAEFRMGEGDGSFQFHTAPSGTAGNAISFTQAMTLDASGNLGLGATTTVGGRLVITQSNATQPAIYLPTDESTIQGPGTDTQIKMGGNLILQSSSQTTISAKNASGLIVFQTGSTPTERARITSGGDLQVKTGTYAAIIAKGGDTDAEGWNGAQTSLYVGKVNGTGRSINAGGTVNASGADYAEYMTKDGDFVIAKGDVCGISANGKLTNVYADAVSFVVKSTNPSYVGNDDWGGDYENDAEGLEAARQKVDRIAFAGQVPVNVLGATPGQYIVPANDNGAIKGVAVSNPSFEQYQAAVGKVIAVEDDGRARIIVKIA